MDKRMYTGAEPPKDLGADATVTIAEVAGYVVDNHFRGEIVKKEPLYTRLEMCDDYDSEEKELTRQLQRNALIGKLRSYLGIHYKLILRPSGPHGFYLLEACEHVPTAKRDARRDLSKAFRNSLFILNSCDRSQLDNASSKELTDVQVSLRNLKAATLREAREV